VAAAVARARKAPRDLQGRAAAVPARKASRVSREQIPDLQDRRVITDLRASRAWQDLEPRALKVCLEAREIKGLPEPKASRA